MRDAVLERLTLLVMEDLETDRTGSATQMVMQRLVQRAKGDASILPPAVRLRFLVFINLHAGRPGFFPIWGAGPEALPHLIRMRSDRHPYLHSFIPYVILELVRMHRRNHSLPENWWRGAISIWLEGSLSEERPYYEGLLALLGDADRLDGVLPAAASSQPADQAWVATLFLDLFGSEMPYSMDDTHSAHLALMGVPGEKPHSTTWATLASQARDWHTRNRKRIRYDWRSGRYRLQAER